MNIIGESFDDFVGTQVDLRQKFYGSSTTVLEGREQYLYNKQPFIKLISSVDVAAEKLKDLGLSESLAGSNLAKAFVLFAGTSEFKGLSQNPDSKITGSDVYNFRAGLNINNDSLGSSAYGLGGLEFGQVPMPGITSATVSYKNRGSLKTATINVKAHNRTQLNIIDALYLRLGYTVLLEWGWGANFLSNSGKVIPQFRKTMANGFLDGTLDSGNILKTITRSRRNSSGNYDALYGTITNFNWSFNPDGTYDITISLVSVGNIIESLTINDYIGEGTILTSDAFQSLLDDVTNQINKATPSNNIIKFAGKEIRINVEEDDIVGISVLPAFLNEFVGSRIPSVPGVISGINYIPINPTTGKPFNTEEDIRDFIVANTSIIPQSASADSEIGDVAANAGLNSLTYYLYKEIQLKLRDPKQSIKYSERVSVLKDDNKTLAFTINWGEKQYFYIKFRTLLRWIQDNLIYNNVNGTKKSKAITFDLNFNDNLIYKNKYSVATDFTKVVTRNMGYPDLNTNEDTSDTINLLDLPDDVTFTSDINPNAGKLMNVFLNLEWLVQTLKSNIDNEGNISLFRFLQTICQGINSSLGHVNSLDVVVDETTNQIKFIDDKPIPGILKDLPVNNKIPTEFQVYAFSPIGNNLNGSFIRDFSIRTEITNKLATTLSIGAQALNAVVTENATALQSWNEGLIDRTAKIKEMENDSGKENQTALQKYKNDIKSFVSLLKKYKDKTLSTATELGTNDLSQLNNLNKNWQKFWSQTIAEANQKASPNGIGFIPINLNLTMDGLSGMKIYQTFTIDSKFLPLNYPEKLQFLIKGISHNIDRDSWTTQIETFSIPKDITSNSSKDPSESQVPDTSGAEGEVSDLLNEFFVLPIKNGQPRGNNGNYGSGNYGASRKRNGESTPGAHKAYDIRTPERGTIPVYAPISGKLTRLNPYKFEGPLYTPTDAGVNKTEEYNINQGFSIVGSGLYKDYRVDVFYLNLDKSLEGKQVEVGQKVGNTIAFMNYAKKGNSYFYGGTGITPHVHLQVFQKSTGKLIDPTPGKGLSYSETLYKN
jgi:hypothetical protein